MFHFEREPKRKTKKKQKIAVKRCKLREGQKENKNENEAYFQNLKLGYTRYTLTTSRRSLLMLLPVGKPKGVNIFVVKFASLTAGLCEQNTINLLR